MKLGDQLNLLLNLGAKQAYFRSDGSWYHELVRFPGILFDPDGYAWFETQQQYHNTAGVHITEGKNSVHVLPGISSLPGYRTYSNAQLALIYQQPGNLLGQENTPVDEETLRQVRLVNLIVRDQKLVARLKKLYSNTCQLCGERIQIRPGEYYSEIHHIKPLGQRHNGPDHESNMLCVCPNHHALLDFFAIRLEPGSLKANKHLLNEVYLNYHNEQFEKLNNS